MGDNDHSDKSLEQRYLKALFLIEERLEYMSQAIDRNTAAINIIRESLPPVPVTPILVSELKYDYKTKTLWADERYYIKFEGKQAQLLARLFTKTGIPRSTPLLIDTLVEESFDYATNKSQKPRTST